MLSPLMMVYLCRDSRGSGDVDEEMRDGEPFGVLFLEFVQNCETINTSHRN